MTCACPAPCDACPPLADDAEADSEFRAARYLFPTKTTGRGRNPRPA